MDNIAIYMADSEAGQFLVFKQHFDFFTTLIDHEVQDVRNGKAILNFDNQALRNIVIEKTVYKL